LAVKSPAHYDGAVTRPITRIREATAAAHARLEATPYARTVLDASLSISAYASFLRALHVVHVALEQAVERSGDADLRALFARTAERRTLLERDLSHLAVDPHGVDFASLAAAVLAQHIRLLTLRDRAQLVGFAYVIEGSQLGGLVQRNALASRPELARGGLAYLAGSGKETKGIFDAFVARLEAGLTDETRLASAIEGAIAAFDGLHAVLEAVSPSDPAARWLVGELNLDAGSHAVPDDAREILAALCAGESTWRRHPYYEARYGERGQRFTRSDSAWLVTLAREDEAQAAWHVSWLARVLAARGMPRLLLEEHLDELHAALCAALPQHAAHYGVLAAAAARLRNERTEAIPDEVMRALVAAQGALSPECGVTFDEAATLVVAAVADERCHIAGAVASLTSWLTDASRFSAAWRFAVMHTLASARDRTA